MTAFRDLLMMKVAVIGGGSTYTPELVNGFLARTPGFLLTELWLMDIDSERLSDDLLETNRRYLPQFFSNGS